MRKLCCFASHPAAWSGLIAHTSTPPPLYSSTAKEDDLEACAVTNGRRSQAGSFRRAGGTKFSGTLSGNFEVTKCGVGVSKDTNFFGEREEGEEDGVERVKGVQDRVEGCFRASAGRGSQTEMSFEPTVRSAR